MAMQNGGSWRPWSSQSVMLGRFADMTGRSGHSLGGLWSRRRDVTVHPAKLFLTDKVVDEGVRPIPLPGEPSPQLKLGRDHRRAYASDDEVLERTARICVCPASCGIDLIPARQLARMQMSLAGGYLQRPRDDRTAPLQRGTQRPQLLPLQPQLEAQILDGGGPSGGEMVQQPAPAAVGCAHALDLRTADRVEQACYIAAHEQVLAAVDRGDQVPRSASSPNHGHFVAGHAAKPGLPGW
jgi:hypothetical protein